MERFKTFDIDENEIEIEKGDQLIEIDEEPFYNLFITEIVPSAVYGSNSGIIPTVIHDNLIKIKKIDQSDDNLEFDEDFDSPINSQGTPKDYETNSFYIMGQVEWTKSEEINQTSAGDNTDTTGYLILLESKANRTGLLKVWFETRDRTT